MNTALGCGCCELAVTSLVSWDTGRALSSVWELHSLLSGLQRCYFTAATLQALVEASYSLSVYTFNVIPGLPLEILKKASLPAWKVPDRNPSGGRWVRSLCAPHPQTKKEGSQLQVTRGSDIYCSQGLRVGGGLLRGPIHARAGKSSGSSGLWAMSCVTTSALGPPPGALTPLGPHVQDQGGSRS